VALYHGAHGTVQDQDALLETIGYRFHCLLVPFYARQAEQ